MTTIVVGFLDIETARLAAKEAARMASALGGRLHIVTPLEDPNIEVLEAGGEEFVVDDYRTAEQAVQRFVGELDEQLSVSVTVRKAKPADLLLEEAERLEADMIVVGNVRMQGPGRILGSVGSKIVHNAPCNVLIVKTT